MPAIFPSVPPLVIYAQVFSSFPPQGARIFNAMSLSTRMLEIQLKSFVFKQWPTLKMTDLHLEILCLKSCYLSCSL